MISLSKRFIFFPLNEVDYMKILNSRLSLTVKKVPSLIKENRLVGEVLSPWVCPSQNKIKVPMKSESKLVNKDDSLSFC